MLIRIGVRLSNLERRTPWSLRALLIRIGVRQMIMIRFCIICLRALLIRIGVRQDSNHAEVYFV